MRLKFAIPLAFAAVCLPIAGTAFAQTYAGGSTAGDLPATAEIVPGVAGVTYTAISGTTLATNGVYTAGDLYQITVAVPETFTASTTAFVPGSNNFDDQISLFNSSGVGVVTNDDTPNGGDQSSLSTGSTLLAPGNYYLLITGSGNYPVDSSGALIFPSNFAGGSDPTGTYAATSTLPLTAFSGNTNEGGSYLIAITAVPNVVPEPSTLAAIAAGFGGLALVLRRRRSG